MSTLALNDSAREGKPGENGNGMEIKKEGERKPRGLKGIFHRRSKARRAETPTSKAILPASSNSQSSSIGSSNLPLNTSSLGNSSKSLRYTLSGLSVRPERSMLTLRL